MKTRFLLGLLCLMIFSSGYSQKKKDLLAEIDRLNSELSSKEEALVEARKSENASVAKAESFEAQLTELQQANATLLNNLKVLTEATKERSNNIGRPLESLREKESQISEPLPY